jgi:hypothetical protein
MAQLRACERQVEDIKPEVEEETKQSSCPPTAIAINSSMETNAYPSMRSCPSTNTQLVVSVMPMLYR